MEPLLPWAVESLLARGFPRRHHRRRLLRHRRLRCRAWSGSRLADVPRLAGAGVGSGGVDTPIAGRLVEKLRILIEARVPVRRTSGRGAAGLRATVGEAPARP